MQAGVETRPSSPSQDKRLPPTRILLADDHADFLAVVVRLLEAEYEVVKTVSDGQAVVDEAASLRPDLIVLDISMPVLNGIAAVQRLRDDGYAGRIDVALHAVHADVDFVRAGMAAGAQGFVVKNRLASDLSLPALARGLLAGRSYVSPNLTC